jgi:hypothetical protein
MKFLQTLSDWSEVWALLIPLIVIIVSRPKEKQIRVLVWYVIIGFILNFATTFMIEFRNLVPSWLYIDNMINNNIVYNIHSMFRVLLFSWYIINIRQYQFTFFFKTFLVAYLVFIFINFTIFESPFFLSTRLFAAESIVLLIMCLFYFFRSIQDESQINWLKHPSFLVCAGISLYEVITFFIFLFFYPLSQKDPEFFVVTMRIYSITFVLLCILLSLAFYSSKKQQSGQICES